MDIVLRETDRLNRLITDFLLYARPGPLQLEAVPLQECVDEMLEMLEASVPPGVRVAVDVGSGLAVQADAAQLRQVLWNLAQNGCQAMPEGGRLGIRADPVAEASQERSAGSRKAQEEGKSAWVDVTVQDQGAGIPPDAMDHVFEPFFTTKQEGTGLGLATVHRIVQEHGGSIRVETGSQGTSFRIRLPRAEVAS